MCWLRRPTYRRRILAAGEMRELGQTSPQLHREAGSFAAKTGKIDWVIGVEGDAAQIVEGAVAAGVPQSADKFFSSSEEAANFLADFVAPGDLAAGERFARSEDGAHRRGVSRAATAAAKSRRRCGTEMLYYLLYHVLQRYFSPLNVFRYITVRTVYASLTAMFLALVFGPWLIRRLRELQIGQFIREEGPQEHQKKAGTPTMGGVLIVFSTACRLAVGGSYQRFCFAVMFALLAFCRHRICR